MRASGKLNFPRRGGKVFTTRQRREMGTVGYDSQVDGNWRYRDLIKDRRKAIIDAALYRFQA